MLDGWTDPIGAHDKKVIEVEEAMLVEKDLVSHEDLTFYYGVSVRMRRSHVRLCPGYVLGMTMQSQDIPMLRSWQGHGPDMCAALRVPQCSHGPVYVVWDVAAGRS